MFAVSGLATHLFLGSWHTGLLPFEPSIEWGFWLGNLLNAGVFIGKSAMLVAVMMWMRWSLPRLRIDQVMMVCLKYFLPISCLLLLGVSLWLLYVPHPVQRIVPYLLSGLTLVSLALVGLSLWRAPGWSARGTLGGVWAGESTPRMSTITGRS
jgi:NADH-quinone oxidoreductase subunit H